MSKNNQNNAPDNQEEEKKGFFARLRESRMVKAGAGMLIAGIVLTMLFPPLAFLAVPLMAAGGTSLGLGVLRKANEHFDITGKIGSAIKNTAPYQYVSDGLAKVRDRVNSVFSKKDKDEKQVDGQPRNDHDPKGTSHVPNDGKAPEGQNQGTANPDVKKETESNKDNKQSPQSQRTSSGAPAPSQMPTTPGYSQGNNQEQQTNPNQETKWKKGVTSSIKLNNVKDLSDVNQKESIKPDPTISNKQGQDRVPNK